jgi:N-carbamoylputrescine amidase
MSASFRTLRTALCQILVIDGDREGNFRRIEYALEAAREGGAALAVFPESAILGWEYPGAHRQAAPIPGADSDRLAALARVYGLMIAIGLDERDGGELYDSAILLDREGRLLWKHRKLNVLAELMDPPYSVGAPESIGVAETEYGRLGLLICADTFTDDYVDRMAALRPDLLLVPYGWAAEAHEWPQHADALERLVADRARRAGCPVVGVDLVGAMSEGPWRGKTYGGASVVADAGGRVLHRLRDRDAEVRVVEVPLGNHSIRDRSPAP